MEKCFLFITLLLFAITNNIGPIMKKIVTISIMMLMTVSAIAQMVDPVKFTATIKTNGTAEAEIVFRGSIEEGWHVYSTNLGNNGPTEASLHINKMDGIELIGKLMPRGNELKHFDPMFGMNVRFFNTTAQFVQRIRFTKPTYSIDAYLEYGACNDESCLPPGEVALVKSGKAPAVITEKTKETKKECEGETAENTLMVNTDTVTIKNMETLSSTDSVTTVVSSEMKARWWQPVIKELQAYNDENNIANRSLWYIFIMGFIGGLLALVMPCIWPIIPMTISFFLKRAKDDRKKGIKDAVIYGMSIIIIYLTVGLLITGLYGPNKLNELSTSAVFNIVLFVLLLVFALSFFGWFEIKLPEKWANAVDTRASNTTGLISIFLMAFTLVLVSFSCTAPIIGLLLVETVTSGDRLSPTIGMLGFSMALALPFTLFALFPSWLKSAPRSGSWMTTIKVVLGFIELAFALKFLSVADLAYGWHILDREVFISLWIVIFGAMGLYLIGKLKFREDTISGDINRPMPVPCIMLGLCSIAFAIYMLPGLWGAPCKAISAFAPPITTQDFNLNSKNVDVHYTDYEKGMAAAMEQKKPVLIDFTGFGCVNCRKMEAAVWTDPNVSKILNEKYILISLYVDDKTPLENTIEVDYNGRKRILRTIGDKWSYLQASKFGANAQPFYITVDNEGYPLNKPYGYNENIPAYINFLQESLNKYHK